MPKEMDKNEVIEACKFVYDCIQMKEVVLDSDFGVTLIGVLKGMGFVIKNKDPELYVVICEALSILANK